MNLQNNEYDAVAIQFRLTSHVTHNFASMWSAVLGRTPIIICKDRYRPILQKLCKYCFSSLLHAP